MRDTHSRANGSRWAIPFFTIWAGQALSLIGSRAGGFALVWWLTRETGSATVLASASLIATLPTVILGPFAGALVDRWNRRTIMILADSAVALLSAWLAYLFWTDAVQVWQIYVIMFGRALGGAFHWPAMQASTSLMVPKEQLARVAGMNQTLQGILNILGPPLGAFLMSVLPLSGVMAIDVATAAFAIVPLLFVHIPQPQRGRTAAGEPGHKLSLLADVRAGFLYIWRWPGVFAVLIMATVVNLMVNPGFSLMPLLVTEHFQGDAWHLGGINSAWGLGVVLGGLTLSVWGGFRRRILTSLVGLVGMGAGILMLGFAPSTAFWLALGAMFVTGFTNPIVNGPFFAIIQSTVAPEMQGRVFTVIGSMSAAASPLGLAIAGPVADALGIQAWFIMGGVTCLILAAVAAATPAIVHLEDRRETGTAVEREPLATAETGAR
jgi:DHA3 family macrolide efflux protein-like MFS transporter